MQALLAGILSQYRRGRAVFVITTLIVALGVTATTAILALAERIVLRPLPLPEPAQLIALRSTPEGAAPLPNGQRPLFPESYLNLLDYERAVTTIAHHAWFLTASYLSGDGDQTLELNGAGIRGRYFEMLGVAPQLGRFPSAENLERGELLVVISHGLWQRRFGGAADVIGRTIPLNGRSYQITAVLPPRAVLPSSADVLVPLEFTEAQRTQRSMRYLFHLGRLRPGATIEQAQAECERVGAMLREQHPEANQRWLPTVESFPRLFVDGQDRTVLILLATAALLLLLAMMNLGSLVLAQAAQRSHETAVRLAIGATARDVVGLALARTFCLTLPGITLGLFGAWWATPRLGLLNPNPFFNYLYDGLELNLGVVTGSAGLTLGLALIAGLLPAWQNLTVETGTMMRESTRGGGASARVLRTQRWLIRTQLALTSGFLVVAGLLGLSYYQLRQVDHGAAVAERVAVSFTLPSGRYATEAPFHQLARTLQDRLSAQRTLSLVTLATNLPVGDLEWSSNFATVPRDNAPQTFELQMFARVSETFPEAAGLRLLRGRAFTVDDRSSTQPVCLVNESLARRFWPGADAVGQTIFRRRGTIVSPPILVVGVLSDALVGSPRNRARPMVYLPIVQSTPNSAVTVLAASPLPAREAIAEVKAAVAAVDPTLAVSYASALSERYENTVSVERFQARLLGAMGAVCLLITALGIYGMVDRHTTAREVEFAVRAALGAQPRELVWLHLRGQLALTGSAVLAGLAGAALVLQRVDLELFNLSPLHPLPYGAAALLILGLVLASMFGPLARVLRAPVARLLRG